MQKKITLEVVYLPQIYYHTMFQDYILNGAVPVTLLTSVKLIKLVLLMEHNYKERRWGGISS
jgi:hypothetical protein